MTPRSKALGLAVALLLAAGAVLVRPGLSIFDVGTRAASEAGGSPAGRPGSTLAPAPPRVRTGLAIDAPAPAAPADPADPVDPEFAGALYATVVGSDGGPCYAGVVVRRPDGSFVSSSDLDGGFRSLGPAPGTPVVVPGLPVDVPLVSVAGLGGESPSAPLPFRIDPATREARVDLRLRPAATIVVRARDEEGRPSDEPLQVRVTGPHLVLRWLQEQDTEESGVWRSGALSAGRWTLVAMTSRRRAAPTTVDVAAGETAEVDVRLGLGAAVEGVVVDGDGRPVAGARVRAHAASRLDRADAVSGRATTSDERGRFTLTGFESGALRLTAETPSDDATPWAATPELVPVNAPSTGVRLVIVPTIGARVVVRTPDGTPYSGPIDVRFGLADESYLQFLRDEPHLSSGPGLSVTDGVLEVCDVPSDRQTLLTLVVKGYLATGTVVRPQASGVVDLGELRLDAGATLSGVVRDAEGRPIAGARVEELGPGASVWSDESGRFTLSGLAHAPVVLRASSDEYASAWAEVADPDGAAPIEFRLPRGARVRATLWDTNHHGLACGVIFFRPAVADVEARDASRVVRLAFLRGYDALTVRLATGRWRVSAQRWPDGVEHEIGVWTLSEGDTRAEAIVVPDEPR